MTKQKAQFGQTLAAHGEAVHLGRGEYLLAGRCRKGSTRDGDGVMAETVKLQGCHVDMDGGTRTDTTKRLCGGGRSMMHNQTSWHESEA